VCTNFIPTAADDLVLFGIANAPFEYKQETYPGYEAPVIRPIVRKSDGEPEGRECIPARFGLIPYWVSEEEVDKPRLKFATYNARVETVGSLASFKRAWKNRQYCLIPLLAFYEPNWETGKAVRWKIWLKDADQFAVAGLWERWRRGEKVVDSFTMLTVNADDHPVMNRMHRPGDEKRMPVILRPDDYDRWLRATPEEAFRMCQQYPAELMQAEAAPAPPRKLKLPPVNDSGHGESLG